LPALPADVRCEAARKLLERWEPVGASSDTWTIERWRASHRYLDQLGAEQRATCPGKG
jgi:hypothetical protein